MIESSLEHARVPTPAGSLEVVAAGAGPRVVLLHGFPETWWAWRNQIDPLVRAGFSVVAANLRGYGDSSKPRGLRAYRVSALVEDVVALITWRGNERAHVVGHDWGGVLSFSLGATRPELVDKLAILNAPHPRIFARRGFFPPQLLRSSYVFFFQLPVLPERALSKDDFAALKKLFAVDPVRKGAYTDEDVRHSIDALSKEGSLRAALSYYRALRLVRDTARSMRIGVVRPPTLVIWGERDRALGTELLDGLEELVPDLRVHRIPGASHWVQNDAPDEVNRVLVDFLRG